MSPSEPTAEARKQYADWIAAEYAGHGYGKCDEATTRMVASFSELRRTRGMYHCPMWGERTHWWCVATDGTIVDPTAGQFPSMGMGEYQEITDDADCPTGVCLDCGAHVYKDATFCSPECERATRAYLGLGAHP